MSRTILEQQYSEYNPNEDYNGEVGLAIAEEVFKKCGYDFDKLHKWIAIHKLSVLEQEALNSLKR